MKEGNEAIIEKGRELFQKRQKENFKPTNPKDRLAISKVDLSLFPDTALVYGAIAMTEGDLKYGGFNFRSSGVLASVYIAAARRHMAKWFNGEDHDPLTGVHHLGNALACIAIIIDALEAGALRDDRPPKVDLGGLCDRAQEAVKKLQGIFPDGPERFTEALNGKKQ